MKLIGLIAVTLALATLRWCAQPHLWRAALVAALCAPLSDNIPTVHAAALEPAFTDPVNVSEKPGYSRHPQIASKGDKQFVVWMDGANILYRRLSIVGGTPTPDATVKITDLPSGEGATNSPQIATDSLDTDTNVYVVYTAWSRTTSSDIFLKRSTDGGVTFGPAINLSNNKGTSFVPRVAVAGKKVFVTWGDFTAPEGTPVEDAPSCPGGGGANFDLAACRFNIFVAASEDGGASFGKAVNVSGRASANGIPAIAAARFTDQFAMAYVTWPGISLVPGSGINVFFSRSTDNGASWEGALECPGDPGKLNCGTGYSKNPQVAASDDGDVYVAWAERPANSQPGEEDIHIVVGRNRAFSFGTEFNLSHNPGVSDYPELAISPGGVQVVWHDGSTGVMDVFHSRSTNGGNDFSQARSIALSQRGFTYRPRVATSGNNVHVIWSDGADIYYGLSTDNGLAFDLYQLSVGFGDYVNALRPRLAPNGSFVSTIWDQGVWEPLFTLLPGGEREIFVESTLPSRVDLVLSVVEAVQAPFEGKALAKGKPTLLRVKVQNQSSTKRDTKLKLVYDTVQGGVPTTVTQVEPIELTPGVNTFLLPADSFILPDGSVFKASAMVDPDGEIGEVNEGNNTASTTVPVKDTGSLRVLYVPVRIFGREAPTCEQVRRVMETSHRYIRATYPIEPRRLKSDSTCTVFEAGEFAPLNNIRIHRLLYNLESRAKLSHADIIVGVVPEGWFTDNTEGELRNAQGIATSGRYASIVEARLPDSAAMITAHEIAHNLGWVKPGHELEDTDHPHHLKRFHASGYWVTERREVKGNDFMYFRETHFDTWIIADSYEYLMNALIQLNQRPDPRVILLRGAIGAGGATLDPWYQFDSLLDVQLNNPGAYSVTYLDGAGQPLGETAFDLAGGELADGGGGALDTIPFSRLIPEVPGTRKIVLKKGSQVLAERYATANSPTVRVLSPNGGERFNAGASVRVTWQSADADGDALKHAVLFSRDAGQSWLPLAMDYVGHEFSFTLDASDASKDARVKVLVTDGFHGAEDSSDAGFLVGAASAGLTFGPSQMVRDNVSTYPIMATARTAASGDNVYAVWSERTCNPGCRRAEVLFRRSTDNGTSFDPLIYLSTNANPNEIPVVAVSGNDVYVAWNEDVGQIALRRSTDSGATFGPTVILTTNGGFPQIAAAGDSVYVVWQAVLPISSAPFFQSEAFFRASTDRGANFGPMLNLSATETRDSMRPQLVAAGSSVYVAWSEGGLGDNSLLGPFEIRVRRSVDGGATFDPSVNLPGKGGRQTYGPGTTAYGIVDAIRLAATGNNLYVAWRDSTDFRASIKFTRSVDAGATFAPTVELSNTSRSPWFAQLAASAGRVYVAWSEGTDVNDGGTGTMDVLFRASADGGASFGAEAVLSTSQGRALFPHLVAQGDSVNLIWQRDRPSTGLPWETVFRQSTDRGQSFGPAVILGTEQIQVGYPQLAVTPENVYATWLGYYGYPTNSRDYRYIAFRAGTVGEGVTNRPPAANAGPDRTVTEGSVVTLMGLGTDLDGDAVSFSWQQTGGPAVSLADADSATTAFTAPVGSANNTLTFQLTANDGKLGSAPSDIRITVTTRPPITDPTTQAPWLAARTTWEDRLELPTPVVVGGPEQGDTTPPVTTATLDGTLGSNGWYKAGELVRLTLTATDAASGVASTSYAVNGGAKQTYGGPVIFTDGIYTVTYGSVDRAGNVETPKSLSFKVDQTAPKFTACGLSPAQLWPPNHKMVNVTTSITVADSGSGPAGFVLKSVGSSEPDNGLGDGDTANDIQGFEVGKPDTQGQLRAERSGLGSGRVYTLTYQTLDAAGNVQTCSATATVPHDQGPAMKPQAERLPGSNAESVQGSPSNNLVAPIVFQAAGPIAASIQGTVEAFRSALGPNNGNEAGPLPSGRREIDWDGGQNNWTTEIARNPFRGFEVSRGALFITPDGIGFVQAPPAADPILFPPGGLARLFDNPMYGALVRTFSPPRLFSAIGSNVFEVDFVVPGGGDTPATTRGFGAVFTRVGEPDGSTLIEYFGADGTLLFSSTVPASPGDGGLSFFGIVFDDARIGWVRITSGDATGPDHHGQHGIVVMDDLIYGEPQTVR